MHCSTIIKYDIAIVTLRSNLFMAGHFKRLLHPACPNLVEGFAMTKLIFRTVLLLKLLYDDYIKWQKLKQLTSVNIVGRNLPDG
jgi:hypothetical protein